MWETRIGVYLASKVIDQHIMPIVHAATSGEFNPVVGDVVQRNSIVALFGKMSAILLDRKLEGQVFNPDFCYR